MLEDSSLMRSDVVLTLLFPVRLSTISFPVGLESSALLLWEPKRLHFVCYFMWVWFLICHTKEKREINVIKLYHDIICSSFFISKISLCIFICAMKINAFNNVTVWYKLNKCTLWKQTLRYFIGWGYLRIGYWMRIFRCGRKLDKAA